MAAATSGALIGPDKYCAGPIDDSAFTNVMARWNIRRALDVAALYASAWPKDRTRLSSRVDLGEAELKSVERPVAGTICPVSIQTGFSRNSKDVWELEGQSIRRPMQPFRCR